MTNMWMVRAKGGFLIDDFREKNIVAIGWKLGDLTGKSPQDIKNMMDSKYSNNKKMQNAMACSQINKFVFDFKKEDYVLTYDSPISKYLLGKIKSDYYYNSDLIKEHGNASGYNHIRDIEWLGEIHRDKLKRSTKNTLNNRVTVFNINEDAQKDILNKYEGKSEDENFESNFDYPFNKIFFGAPGTGKSYTLNQRRKDLLGEYKDNYERVTFHPDYTYANFVGAYKPVSVDGNDIAYEFVPGPFMRLLVKALNYPENPHILIIEEINRANVAAVFGDVFQLLDRKKDKNKDNYGVSEYPINVSHEIKSYLEKELTNDPISYDTIVIPSNMYIWATMNSADQGVYMMDTAFKRRWDFKYIPLKNDIINDYRFVIDKQFGFDFKDKDNSEFIDKQVINWNELRTAINNYLLDKGINEDKLLGPFFVSPEYFYKKEDFDKKGSDIKHSEKFLEVFKNKVLMYLFEDVLKARGRNDLFKGISGDKNVLFSEVQEKFDDIYLDIFANEILDKINIEEIKEK